MSYIPNTAVYQQWVSQNSTRANNTNCSFVGRDCFSYGTLIGRIYKSDYQELYVLTKYYSSVSTTCHVSLAARHVPNRRLVIIEETPILASVNYYIQEKEDKIDFVLSKLRSKRTKLTTWLPLAKQYIQESLLLHNFIGESTTCMEQLYCTRLLNTGRWADQQWQYLDQFS